ncbi:single-stranded DNA-binding protein [Georgenia sunbinii]|uniref:single-stranded DNA-binding protein n=1 Tax=Georgenia sunbinii TaxID=3117728 RepID=UPI002F260935
MSDSNLITLRGRVGTEPSIHITAAGRQVVNFRLGSTSGFMDPVTRQWRDKPTEWFTVKVWGPAGDNVTSSLTRGTPVIVQGVLSSEEWTSDDGTRHTNVVTSRTIGVDIRYGRVTYTKVTRETPGVVAGSTASADAAASADEPGGPDEDTEEYLAPEPVEPLDWEKLAG